MPKAFDPTVPLRSHRADKMARLLAAHPGMRIIEAYKQSYTGSDNPQSASNIAATAKFKARLLHLKAEYAREREEARGMPEGWSGFIALWYDLIKDLESLVDLAVTNGVDAAGVRSLIVSLAGKLVTSQESLAAADAVAPELHDVPVHLRRRRHQSDSRV